MAEKRMFSQKIISSDDFLDLPLSAQALYFHLNMNADDDGFIDNKKTVLRTLSGASDEDLKILIKSRFLIAFDNGIVVVKHWKIHNTIQKDRYKPTQYREQYALIKLKENKSYTEKETVSKMETNCIQTVSKMETQIRIDKNRIDKSSKKESKKERKSNGYDKILSAVEDEALKDLYFEYIKMRKLIKSPLTDRALTMLIKKVNTLEPDNIENQKKLLETAILSNWKSVYALKEEDKKQTEPKEETIHLEGIYL